MRERVGGDKGMAENGNSIFWAIKNYSQGPFSLKKYLLNNDLQMSFYQILV